MSDLRELARSLRPYIEQAARSMEYTYGLYYSDPGDSKVYLCTRTGEIDGGTITLSLQKTDRKARLTVSNPGDPIPPEQLRRLFERFYRADASRGEQSGFGLGLPIAAAVWLRPRGTATTSIPFMLPSLSCGKSASSKCAMMTTAQLIIFLSLRGKWISMRRRRMNCTARSKEVFILWNLKIKMSNLNTSSIRYIRICLRPNAMM